MRDTRVRPRPAAGTFRLALIAKFRGFIRAMKAAALMVARAFRDIKNPPSPERLWIREHARAELAEAELWFARRCAARSAA